MELTDENYEQLDILFQRLYDEEVCPRFGNNGLKSWEYIQIFEESVTRGQLKDMGISIPDDEEQARHMRDRIAEGFMYVASNVPPPKLSTCKGVF